MKQQDVDHLIHRLIFEGIDAIQLRHWPEGQIWSWTPSRWSEAALKVLWHLKTHNLKAAQTALDEWQELCWSEHERARQVFAYLFSHLMLKKAALELEPCTRLLKQHLFKEAVSLLGDLYLYAEADIELERYPKPVKSPHELVGERFPVPQAKNKAENTTAPPPSKDPIELPIVELPIVELPIIEPILPKPTDHLPSTQTHSPSPQQDSLSSLLASLERHLYFSSYGLNTSLSPHEPPLLSSATEPPQTLILIDADSLQDTPLRALLQHLNELSDASDLIIHCARNHAFPLDCQRMARCEVVPAYKNSADDFLCAIGMKHLYKDRVARLIVFTQDNDFLPMMRAWARELRAVYLAPLRADQSAPLVAERFTQQGVSLLPPLSFWFEG